MKGFPKFKVGDKVHFEFTLKGEKYSEDGEIVVVELGIGVSLVGKLKCQFDEILTDNLVERRAAERAVILDSFVDHIPTMYATFITTHEGGDMLAHTLYENLTAHLLARIVGKEPGRSL